ncbi:zinc finger, CCHC-type containing protein [Tanacetum coccineum]
MPRRYIRVIKDMYDGAKTLVRTLIEHIELFPVEVGIHQGSAISPYLFALILDELLRGIQEDIPWCLIFADDIVLVSESAKGLNNRIKNWREALEDNNLRVSREKTKYLKCNFGNVEIAHNKEVDICIGDNIIQPKESFRYLGSMIHKSGRIDKDVSHRIKAAWLKWRAATRVLCDRNAPLKLKWKFYRVSIRPSMLTMLDMIPNEVYRAKLEVETIINKMREVQLGGLNMSGEDHSSGGGLELDYGVRWQNDLLVVSGSGPAVTSNWAVCYTMNPPELPPIPPEGVKVLASLMLLRQRCGGQGADPLAGVPLGFGAAPPREDMTTKFGKLDKFEGSNFRRCQKKIHFLLTTLKVVYVLSTPMSEYVEEEMMEQTRKRCKWDNDDYICRRHVLNGMSDALFDIYQNVGSAKDLWDQLKAKHMAEDTSSKKFLVNNFYNYRMVDSRSVMEQYHELLRILGQYTQHGLFVDESISMSSIIDKLLTIQLGTHFRINMVEDDKNKKNNKNSKGNKRKFHDKKDDSNKKSKMACWKCGKHGHFKKDCRVMKNNGVSAFGSDDEIAWWIDSGATCHACEDHCRFDTFHLVEYGSVLHMGNESTKAILGHEILELAVVRLPKPKKKIFANKGIDCIFIEYAKHSKAYRFYVIEPNDFVSVNSVIKSRDAIFDENVEEDLKTFNEAMKSRDVAFWKEADDDEIGLIMENNTWVLSDLPHGCKSLGCKYIFKSKMKVDGTIDKFKARLFPSNTTLKAELDVESLQLNTGTHHIIPSTWMAFGGYTRDLGSFGEETDKITTLHRSGFNNCLQSLETASQFPGDAVRSYKRLRQKTYDDVRT